MSSSISTHAEHYDPQASKFGMWLFIFTEILLFGGLFIVYSTYRYVYNDAFHLAARELNLVAGTINSIILLFSSTTVSMAISALQKGDKAMSKGFIAATIILGIIFLVNKYFEWGVKIEHGLYPGSDILASFGFGDTLFFGLYFAMTGLHALHMVIGIVIWIFAYVYIVKGKTHQNKPTLVENAGLYWHLIDVIWIFLFVLFYLIT
ncbi:MAG: cytochrome c oxidase subunit 3 family protein [Bacteroidetes bacterium]|nr:cytochrome c oxidase subunit 3 family protein [Bacteroidales bacterium]NJO69892.1 cytochrome c oxidase subunit 3 family protein [Bacteroidota bacterium]